MQQIHPLLKTGHLGIEFPMRDWLHTGGDSRNEQIELDVEFC
jgi:hypothetical protein